MDEFPTIPKINDLDIIKAIIRENGLDPVNYVSLINLVKDEATQNFMAWLQDKMTQPFSDDPDGLYHDYEALLRARDFLTTQSARATAQYRAAKKRFLPRSGTVVDKEAIQDHDTAPYKYYEMALLERIKTLDNRCTAAKQQQRIIEEGLKRGLLE